MQPVQALWQGHNAKLRRDATYVIRQIAICDHRLRVLEDKLTTAHCRPTLLLDNAVLSGRGEQREPRSVGARSYGPQSLRRQGGLCADPRYPFNSFFSSWRNRQSVPWAMIFCGLDLIMPASWRRRA